MCLDNHEDRDAETTIEGLRRVQERRAHHGGGVVAPENERVRLHGVDGLESVCIEGHKGSGLSNIDA